MHRGGVDAAGNFAVDARNEHRSAARSRRRRRRQEIVSLVSRAWRGETESGYEVRQISGSISRDRNAAPDRRKCWRKVGASRVSQPRAPRAAVRGGGAAKNRESRIACSASIGAADGFRQSVIGAMREGIAVNYEERTRHEQSLARSGAMRLQHPLTSALRQEKGRGPFGAAPFKISDISAITRTYSGSRVSRRVR